LGILPFINFCAELRTKSEKKKVLKSAKKWENKALEKIFGELIKMLKSSWKVTKSPHKKW
jgi:hypothetical protein